MDSKTIPTGAAQIKRFTKPYRHSEYFDIFRTTGKSGGTIVLVYDDPDNGIYETETIYVMRFNSFNLGQWGDIIESFLCKSAAKKE